MLKANEAIDARGFRVAHDDVSEQQRDGSDTATTGSHTMGTLGTVEIGVWEMSVGTMLDVEVDEFFVVIAGHATVEFRDSTPALHLSPGSVVRLAAGTSTRWIVTETLRKVYVVPQLPGTGGAPTPGRPERPRRHEV